MRCRAYFSNDGDKEEKVFIFNAARHVRKHALKIQHREREAYYSTLLYSHYSVFLSFLKSALTDCLKCTRLMASESRGATESCVILSLLRAEALSGIVLVTTTSSSSLRAMRSDAAPDSRPWLAKQNTRIAPCMKKKWGGGQRGRC